MKILELTTYTAGICGVGARVLQEAQLLAQRGHTVRIFSTNFTKGSNEIAPSEDKIGEVTITRLKAKKLGGESFTYWNFIENALEFMPDVIIAHAYRHTHTTLALKIAKMINAKVFLVTHAPFVPDNSTRSFISKVAVNIYDSVIGPASLKKFDKIFAITRWEVPYLKNLGVHSKKIVYSPNGIAAEFFTSPKVKEKNIILFVGRISPIKNLETLILAFHKSNLKDFRLELVGPAEKHYFNELEKLVKIHNIKNVYFMPPIFDRNVLAHKLDEASIFVLPSKREAMPQSLIEAMARSKIVIASENLGTKDLITSTKNGFLFPVGNITSLANLLKKVTNNSLNSVRKNAHKTAIKYKWDSIIDTIEKTIS
jgi:glycosyltransferase involved in cell wall biosynthesis